MSKLWPIIEIACGMGLIVFLIGVLYMTIQNRFRRTGCTIWSIIICIIILYNISIDLAYIIMI